MSAIDCDKCGEIYLPETENWKKFKVSVKETPCPKCGRVSLQFRDQQ